MFYRRKLPHWHPELWLKEIQVAQLVKHALCYGEQERNFYALRAWVIMPNHVHVLLQLDRIVRYIEQTL